MSNFVIENKSNNDTEMISIIINSLIQVKSYCAKISDEDEGNELTYDTKTKEIDLINMLLATSNAWLETQIEDFTFLLNHKLKSVSLTNNDFLVIKYMVSFYWDYVGEKLKESVQSDFPITQRLDSLMLKNKDISFIKIVK